MANIFRLHPEHTSMIVPCDQLPNAPALQLDDMSQLFGGPLRFIAGEEHGSAPHWLFTSSDSTLSAWHEEGGPYTWVRIDGHDGEPEQRLRWSVVQLYAQMQRVVMHSIGIVVEDPQQPESELLLLELENKADLRVPDILGSATEDLFAGEAGELAIAGLVGATDWASFVRTWNDAEQQATPLLGAQYLLTHKDAF